MIKVENQNGYVILYGIFTRKKVTHSTWTKVNHTGQSVDDMDTLLLSPLMETPCGYLVDLIMKLAMNFMPMMFIHDMVNI